MAVKKCSKCKEEKELSEFHKSKVAKDGLQYCCKKCVSDYNEKHKEKYKEYQKGYRKNNKEYNKEYKKEYYIKNKEEFLKRSKEWQKNNKEFLKEYNAKYSKENRDYLTKQNKQKRNTDSIYKLKGTLRSRTYVAFKRSRWNKNSATEKMLGCNYETAHKHLERQFTKGMSWDNHGKWHIDHIIPLSSAKTEEDLINLCHYTNLQPLWAEDNLSKGASIDNQQGKLRL